MQNSSPRHYAHSPVLFLLLTVASQLVGCGAVLVALHFFQPGSVDFNSPRSGFLIFGVLVVFSTVAWGCANFMGLPPLWRIFNALLLPLVLFAQVIDLPSVIYLIGIVAALFLYLPTIWTRVPYYPTSMAMYEAVFAELPDTPIRFMDLGCGFGGLLCYLARKRPESSFVGVELSPLAFLLSKLRVHLSGVSNVEIRFHNLWSLDLEPFEVVYAFLAPPPMPGLWKKAREEMQSGSLLLVNSFAVPGVACQEIQVAGVRQVTLYRYQIT